MFDATSSILTYTTGPLAAALINQHQHTFPSHSSSLHIGAAANERLDAEHESMFTAATSLYRESIYPTSDSPNEPPPIFRNVLHVAIMYGKRRTRLDSPEKEVLFTVIIQREREKERSCCCCSLDARDVMRICLKYGLDPNAPGKHPNPLNISVHSSLPASQVTRPPLTRLSPDLPSASSCRNGTLDYNAYYTTERLFTLPPLFFAAQRNNHYACTLLLRYGANINVTDEQQCSPLHLAARLQHNVCEILISHHAAITAGNRSGDTPLSLWPIVKQLQTTFVEREFRKLCRKHSSSSKRSRFLSRDPDASPLAGTSLLNNPVNSTQATGLKNLRRVFRQSRSDSNDSKSFKKSLSSQSSIGKSRRLIGMNTQSSGQGASILRSDSRQFSDERDEMDLPNLSRSSYVKRKVRVRHSLRRR